MAAAVQETRAEHFSREAATWDAKPFIRAINLRAAELIVENGYVNKQTDALDIGCGTGTLLAALLTRAGRVAGVDIAQGMVDKWTENFRKNGMGPEVATAVCLDLSALPDMAGPADALAEAFRPAFGGEFDGRFDLVSSVLTYHHVEDVVEMTKAAAAVLRPGGVLALFDIMKTPTSHRFHPRCKHHTVYHEGGFELDNMRRMLQDAGLEQAEAKEAHRFVRDVEGAGGPDAAPESMEFTMFMAVGRKPQTADRV